ncbi:hypothetical protein N7541_003280, partial [Penicillium brevicompactum]
LLESKRYLSYYYSPKKDNLPLFISKPKLLIISSSMDGYENVILIANGAGLAAVIPYISILIHGYNTYTIHIRRIHLI